jgi:hypothetical protein
VLAAVGFIVIVGFAGGAAVSYIKAYIGPAETPQFFENYLSLVVMQDPPPFSDINKASPILLLKTAILATVSEDSNQGKYASTDDGREIVPTADITQEFVSFFGENIKPQYQTFTDSSSNYEYSVKEKCYYIPGISIDNFYTSDVESITHKNGTVKLTVGYILGNSVAKTMIYTLKGARGKYVIFSIENGPAKKASTSQSNLSSATTSSNNSSSSSAASSSSVTSSSSKSSIS